MYASVDSCPITNKKIRGKKGEEKITDQLEAGEEEWRNVGGRKREAACHLDTRYTQNPLCTTGSKLIQYASSQPWLQWHTIKTNTYQHSHNSNGILSRPVHIITAMTPMAYYQDQYTSSQPWLQWHTIKTKYSQASLFRNVSLLIYTGDSWRVQDEWHFWMTGTDLYHKLAWLGTSIT